MSLDGIDTDGNYMTLEECVEGGHHLRSIDHEGHCNTCGSMDYDESYDWGEAAA